VKHGEAMTPEEIEEQFGKIRSAAIQAWVTMLLVCGLGVAFVGLPVLFVGLATVHTAGLPFVLSYVRRSRDRLLDEARRAATR
jgi:hypothetical protein